jgi:hypothetical protein
MSDFCFPLDRRRKGATSWHLEGENSDTRTAIELIRLKGEISFIPRKTLNFVYLTKYHSKTLTFFNIILKLLKVNDGYHTF